MGNMPNAADLQYFLEIAQTENLSRAAERLGVSQPSLTLAMRRLEHSVGVELLSRSKRGVYLTPAGKRLHLQAKYLLQEWQSIALAATSSHTQVAGTYKIGCHPSVAIYSLPKVLPKLISDFPDLELQLVHDLSRRITEQVISSKIDLGIVVNPSRHPDLVINQLCKDEVSLWRAAKCINPEVLICDADLLQTQSILKRTKKGNFKRVINSSNLEVIVKLVEAGLGYGIIPGRVVGESSNLQKQKDTPMFEDEICLVYRVESKRIRAIQEIADRIKQAF